MQAQAIGTARTIAGATSGAKVATGARTLFVDNLRILLSILVILHHLAITYGADGGWYYVEGGQINLVSAILMTLFAGVNQAFFMGLFFMLASYFMVASYDRKGTLRFVRDRLKRLGIPLVFYILVINPVLNYALVVYRDGYPGTLLDFMPGYIQHQKSFGDGPLWFVVALLFFSSAYVLWRLATDRANRGPSAVQSDGTAPGNRTIALFALGVAIGTFIVRIWSPIDMWLEPVHWQLAHWTQYVALTLVGVIAYRRNWLRGLTIRQGRVWAIVVLVLLVLFPVLALVGGALEGGLEPFKGGLYWQSLAFCLWEQFMCVAMIVALLVWFRNRFDHEGALSRAMSADAFAVYVFFAPVIVLLSLAARSVTLDMSLKFVLLAPVAVAACFTLGHWVRKLPVARNIL